MNKNVLNFKLIYISECQSVADLRALVESYGLLSVGFDLGVGFACVGLQSSRWSSQRTIDQYEFEDEGYDHWKPSETDVALSRAMLNLADVWLVSNNYISIG